jgi:hypothetical protein
MKMLTKEISEKKCFCDGDEDFKQICSECNNRHPRTECIRQNNVGVLWWYCPICKVKFQCGTLENTQNGVFCEGGLNAN